MIAIALQTVITMSLCFAIGFITAWVIRGGREQRGFEHFFANWRSRYDKLERDCDEYLARINGLQKDLRAANEQLTAPRETPYSGQSNAEMAQAKD
jgi:hypothetical protein